MAEQMMQGKASEMAAKQTIPTGYKQTEVGVIPEDWECKHIGELGDVVRGGSPRPAGDARFFNGNFIPWLTVASLTNISPEQMYVVDTATKLTELGSLRSRVLNEDTLIISNSGATLGVAKILKIKCCANDGVAALVNQCLGNKSFLAHYINTQTKKLQEQIATGNGQPNLNTDLIKVIPVPFPREAEQAAIANVLSDTDALIEGLEQLIAKKQGIKTAAMQQLLTGLTRLPQFALRPDGTPKGYKSSELGQIPEDWDALTYGDIFTFLSTATNSRADLSNSGDFGYIHYGDIHTKWNNKLDLCVFDLPRVSRHLVSSSFVENGDVIMADASEDYDGIGKSVEICNVGDDKIVSGLHTFLLRDKNQLLVDGYRGFLHSIPAVKKAFDRLATGMKVYGISKNNLIVVPVPLPPKQEQTAIATILSDMDSELAALEQKLAKARDLKQGMMQQLLTGRIRLPLPKEA
jgi:type I restriction enzyme S subunit